MRSVAVILLGVWVSIQPVPALGQPEREITEPIVPLLTITLPRDDNGYETKVHDVAFSPDGKTLAAAVDGGNALLLEVATGR